MIGNDDVKATAEIQDEVTRTSIMLIHYHQERYR